MSRRILIPILVLMLIASSVLTLRQTQRLRRAQLIADEQALAALNQAAEEMQSLTLSLEKLTLSAHAAHQARLLHAVALSAGDVQQCLAALPLEQDAAAGAMSLMGQLQAEASSLLPSLTRAALTDDQRSALQHPLALCSRLSSQLSLLRDENAPAADALLNEDYPLPEVRPPASPRGLPDHTVTREAAREAARSLAPGSVLSVEDAPDASGVLPAYGFTVKTEDLQLNMEITCQGGKLLWMMPETAGFSPQHTAEECVAAALAFLDQHGFGSAEAVYLQQYDGLCVVAAAPLQDGVLLYPDLLTVQVRMDTLDTAGLEARSYWTNHTTRTLSTPALTADDAFSALAGEPVRRNERLCVIPAGDGEALCWQCTVEKEGDTYLIYVDAATGEEKAIRKVIPLDNGFTEA